MPSPALVLVMALLAGDAAAAPPLVRTAVYPDPDLAAYVQAVGARVAAPAGLRGLRFVVADVPEANAYAPPGGRIVVTRGMIALASDEAELAAVLAHEVAHVMAGHPGAPPADPAAAEGEADRVGLRLLAAAGYDPRAQPDMQATLVGAHGLDGTARPALADRLRASAAAAARFGPGGTRDRARYLAAVDGLAWGPRVAGLRLRLHRIAPGDDVAALAAAMPVRGAPARFDILNGLAPGESLRVGDVIKLVVR